MGVWEQMLVMLILEEGFREDWRGGSGGGGGGGLRQRLGKFNIQGVGVTVWGV